jgi:hypothetical protein
MREDGRGGDLEDICSTRRDGSTNTIIFFRKRKSMEKIFLNRLPIVRFATRTRHSQNKNTNTTYFRHTSTLFQNQNIPNEPSQNGVLDVG